MILRRTGAALTLAATLGAAAPAALAGEGDCFGFDSVAASAPLSLAAVGPGAARVHFVRNASAAPGCPGAQAGCREGAYLVPGDRVIVGARQGAFACADYVTPEGRARAGWLPAAALEALPEPAPGLGRWVGRWTGGPEHRITIAEERGRLRVEGEATYGALDPDRVRRGAVNLGSLEATAAPQGAVVAFTMADETLPYEAGDQYDCRARLRLLGPYLLAEDNGNCGGFNVSFRGIYAKRP